MRNQTSNSVPFAFNNACSTCSLPVTTTEPRLVRWPHCHQPWPLPSMAHITITLNSPLLLAQLQGLTQPAPAFLSSLAWCHSDLIRSHPAACKLPRAVFILSSPTAPGPCPRIQGTSLCPWSPLGTRVTSCWHPCFHTCTCRGMQTP